MPTRPTTPPRSVQSAKKPNWSFIATAAVSRTKAFTAANSEARVRTALAPPPAQRGQNQTSAKNPPATAASITAKNKRPVNDTANPPKTPSI